MHDGKLTVDDIEPSVLASNIDVFELITSEKEFPSCIHVSGLAGPG